MSRKERTQLIVFNKLKNNEITQKEAAKQLNFSARWIRKKMKRYLEFGDSGLIHQNRGKVSPKRWNEKEKEIMLNLVSSDWQGFGPTLVSEKLQELKDINVSNETVRTEMIAAGKWESKRKRSKHRKRRNRRPMKGLLTQLDGSPHDWFEGRTSRCTLLVFIDDATSQLLWLEFVRSENEIDVMRATKNYISRRGIPHAFYVDYGGVFSVNTNNPERDKKTQWHRAADQLSIKVNFASSPQAKGRVERANATLQDRLVKEMRLAGISSINDANIFLQTNNYIAKHNQRFSVAASEPGDAHKPSSCYDLDIIYCIKDTRILANDYTIQYKKHIYQIEPQQKTVIKPKDQISVNVYLDGTIELWTRNTKVAFHEIKNRPQKLEEIKIYSNQPRRPHVNSQRWASGRLYSSRRVG